MNLKIITISSIKQCMIITMKMKKMNQNVKIIQKQEENIFQNIESIVQTKQNKLEY